MEENKELFVYKCHLGLTEAISPIYYNNNLLGYLMMGQILEGEPDETKWKQIYQHCQDKNYNLNLNKLKSAFFNLNYLNRPQINAAARIMDRNAKYTYLSEIVKVQRLSVLKKIDYYLESHLEQDISRKDLANFLNYSQSHVSHLIKSKLNCSFTQYLRQKRMQKAKKLLQNTDLQVKKIAAKVGFSDPNYFSRRFKKATGLSPTSYRKYNTKTKTHS